MKKCFPVLAFLPPLAYAGLMIWAYRHPLSWCWETPRFARFGWPVLLFPPLAIARLVVSRDARSKGFTVFLCLLHASILAYFLEPFVRAKSFPEASLFQIISVPLVVIALAAASIVRKRWPSPRAVYALSHLELFVFLAFLTYYALAHEPPCAMT